MLAAIRCRFDPLFIRQEGLALGLCVPASRPNDPADLLMYNLARFRRSTTPSRVAGHPDSATARP